MNSNVEQILPYVTVVVPMLNEGKYIATCLKSLLSQNYPSSLLEIIVVDGGSSDESCDIVNGFVRRHTHVKLLGGPGVNCPAAMNIGINQADPRSSVVAKVDAHGYVGADFVRIGVSYLTTLHDTKCVGGPIRLVPATRVEISNSIARTSVFGVGGGIYSLGNEMRYVESVQCGLYSRDVFDEVGLFDEALQFGEDEELNWRIGRHGHRILLSPDIQFFYCPRPSFLELFREYRNYGRARIKVVRKHPSYLRLKHAVPPVFVAWLTLAVLLAPFSAVAIGILSVTLCAYLFCCLAVSVGPARRRGWWLLGALPVSFFCLHFGYGFGCWAGLFGVFVQSRPHRQAGVVVRDDLSRTMMNRDGPR